MMKRVRLSDYNDSSENEDIIKDAIKTSTESIITKNLLSDNGGVYVPKLEIEQGSSDSVPDMNEADETDEGNATCAVDPVLAMFKDKNKDRNKHNIVNNKSDNNKVVEESSSGEGSVQGNTQTDKNDAPKSNIVMVMPGAGGAIHSDVKQEQVDLAVTSDRINEQRHAVEEKINDTDSVAEDTRGPDKQVSFDDRNDDKPYVRKIDSSMSTKPRDICEDDDNFYVSRVDKFPRNVMDFICEQFDLSGLSGRKAPGMGTILAAYIFIKEGYPSDMRITQKVSDIVDRYKGSYEISNADIQERLLTITDRFNAEFNSIRQLIRQDVMKKLTAVEIASLYNLFRQMQFSVQDRVGAPSDIDFQERGMAEMQQSLERQTINKLEKDKIDNGRDVYNAKYKEG